MADVSNKISWSFLGDARNLVDATRGANRALESTEAAGSRTDRALGRMDDAVRNLAIGLGAAEIGRFALDSIAMADSAEQAAESAEAVLGPALDSLHERLEGIRGTMGLNIGEVDALAAKYGLLTDGMGLTDEAQADFIATLVEVGGDLAAYNGRVGEVEAAIDSLGGAVRGEFDSLEQWGVKISAAALQAKALELATDPANASLSEQELQLLALTTLIKEQAAPAMGALKDAQDDNAAKANELKTKWEDVQIMLGNFLSPALNWFLDLLLRASEAWGRLTDKAEFWNTRLGHWTRSFLNFMETVLAPFIAMWNAIRDAIQFVIEKVQWLIDLLGKIKFPELPSWVPFVGSPDGPGKSTGTFGPKGGSGPVVGGGSRASSYASMPATQISVEAGIGDPQAIAQRIVELLQQYELTNGALPVTVLKSEQ